MTSLVDTARASIGRVLLGKDQKIRLALACLLARGHLLIEDLPGMGKTTLAHALAHVLGLSYQRIQFTSDLLPADILGVSIFNTRTASFEFKPGPVFSQVILADEINRATPKTQSALLEAMEERQVTVDGQSHKLPEPFFVIATQNPSSQMGTFQLPESQLDRFLMRISLGYPDPKAEREMLRGEDRRNMLKTLKPAMNLEQLQKLQGLIFTIHVSDAILDYIQRLVRFSRETPAFAHGISPRGTQALLRAAQAWALVEGRDHVIPEDIQMVLGPVVDHRLAGVADAGVQGGRSYAEMMLAQVNVVE
ncbi:MAG TPA: MoxR family ATPase [Pseudomonadales bacterium]|nr:MoxR family ATPase [Pseudomonadales bacterium]